MPNQAGHLSNCNERPIPKLPTAFVRGRPLRSRLLLGKSHAERIPGRPALRVDRRAAFECEQRSIPAESDPTKDPGHSADAKEEPEDLPAEEHRDWRAVQESSTTEVLGMDTHMPARLFLRCESATT